MEIVFLKFILACNNDLDDICSHLGVVGTTLIAVEWVKNFEGKLRI